jgi:hypothetical protein
MANGTEFGYDDFGFSWGDHICAIFDWPWQQMEVMGGFVLQGLRAEQRCVWISSEPSVRRLRAALGSAGGDLQTLEASGQLIAVPDVDFYLQDGLFEPSRTMDLLRALMDDGKRIGYDTMRITTDLSWMNGGRIDPNVWEEFEHELTHQVANVPAVLVCQFDRRQVSGSVVVAAFRTHPIVILGDEIHVNPFYSAGAAGPAMSEIM